MTEPAEASSACALCGSPGTVLHEALDDRLFDVPGHWSLRRCTSCSLVWLDPMPARSEIGALYDSYYTHEGVEGEQAAEAGAESAFHRAVLRGIPAARMGYPEAPATDHFERGLAYALSWIGPLCEIAEHAVMWLPVSHRGRLLDVGCGSGDFLARMRDFGWKVAGVEPDPLAREAARRRLNAGAPGAGTRGEETSDRIEISRDLDDPTLTPGFDAITLSHVIEHVPDPVATLRRCAELLAPGGLLVCITPNTASLGARSFGRAWLHWDPPRHLHLFDRATLERAVREAGLDVQRASTPGSTAHFVWQASTLVERRGRLPGARVAGVSPALFAESLGFWALEYVLTWMGREVGEEVLVVAERAERVETAQEAEKEAG